ncbi:hypothetical protein VNO77_34803 [Canavalia gladiata]|uniref:Uncharacterized protein n=1 Tax=Canavalia gladiata TaxID=3824 RepID=A0AAN9KH08_CANGL
MRIKGLMMCCLFLFPLTYAKLFKAKHGVQTSSNLVLHAWNVYIGLHGHKWMPQASVYLGICFPKLAFAFQNWPLQ